MSYFKSFRLTVVAIAASTAAIAASGKPNVVMIAVDDMNDWISPLGYEQAITPNLERLADMGITFTNAHTPGVFCAPARAAIMTGQYASTTGVYQTQPFFHTNPDLKPLQTAFSEAGYATYCGGKIYHHAKGFVDLRDWDEYFLRDPSQKLKAWSKESWTLDSDPLPDPYPYSPIIQSNPKWMRAISFLEYGPIANEREPDIPDAIRAAWAADKLRERHDKPFFLAVGLYSPHYPNYAPQEYFDLYPAEDFQLPEIDENDLEDVPDFMAKQMRGRKANVHDLVVELEQQTEATRAYLACISYADALVGRILDAIEEGPNRNNTIVIFWSDHGYAHGQKGNWGKHTLWQRTSQVPFFWAGPQIAKNRKLNNTVSLIDIYPTLAELCGLQTETELEGQSLKSILISGQEPKEERTVFLPYDEPNSYAMINSHWRYIRYEDGGEELYNVREDYNEWHNLADNPEYVPIKEKMQQLAPKNFVEPGKMAYSDLRLITEGTSFHWEPKD